MVGPATYLVTPPRRLASQAPAPLRFADSSSLVTPLVTPPVVSADPARSPDGPPATSARARRFPTRESSRDFPADRATAPGSPPCSRGDIPRSRSNAGVRDGANRAQITGCNGRICADRRGSCRAPSRSARHATTLSPVTLQAGSRGKKIHPTKKNFFWMKFRKKTLKTRRHFQTAGRRSVSSRHWHRIGGLAAKRRRRHKNGAETYDFFTEATGADTEGEGDEPFLTANLR